MTDLQESQRSFEQRPQTAHALVRWRRITVNEFAERFLREHVAHLHPRSAGTYHRALEREHPRPRSGTGSSVKSPRPTWPACVTLAGAGRPWPTTRDPCSACSSPRQRHGAWRCNKTRSQKWPAARATAFEQLTRDEREVFVAAAERITPAQAAFTICCAASLDLAVRDHLCALARAAIGETGALSTRRLLLAIAAAHEGGQRSALEDTEVRLFTWFVAHAHLDRLPGPRSRGAAILWLSARTPLITRTRGPQGSRYAVHLDWLAAPSDALIADMKAAALTPS
ncbi:MAG: hypothetical protein IPO88_29245 [Nannocystis sp.]|uniref:hypothetical protein n=1 Tax=Nannocystis sp. TaxID=1962667 RepID=UPI00242521B4|nr:hypothetical protein [Nannocystis sp.]MBK9757517.1 hypothetical protein [Nannocystis sp.]